MSEVMLVPIRMQGSGFEPPSTLFAFDSTTDRLQDRLNTGAQFIAVPVLSKADDGKANVMILNKNMIVHLAPEISLSELRRGLAEMEAAQAQAQAPAVPLMAKGLN